MAEHAQRAFERDRQAAGGLAFAQGAGGEGGGPQYGGGLVGLPLHGLTLHPAGESLEQLAAVVEVVMHFLTGCAGIQFQDGYTVVE